MSEVWCKGDKCLSTWLDGEKLYEACVKKIFRQKDGSVWAKIRYDGYRSEEDVELSRLQRSPVIHVGSKTYKATPSDSSGLKRSIFKPLTGNEEENRIQHKFSHLESEDQEFEKRKCEDTSSPAGSREKTKRRYGPIFDSQEPSTSGGPPAVKRRVSRRSQQDDIQKVSSQVKPQLERAPKANRGKILHEESITTDTAFNPGFDFDDLEKPKFVFPAVTDKVAFQLEEGEQGFAVPATINQYLRDYQREGIKFLFDNYTQKTGAILGDDMGLGKTVQVIGFLSAMLRKQGNRDDVMRMKPQFIRELSDTTPNDETSIHKPFLIIGPGSVLYNWLDELETWGYFTAKKYHGLDKAQTLADVRKGKTEIVVTTYETFRDNVDEMNSIEWCGVIVDEVHRIKGLTSQTTSSLRKIKTLCRFGLTGTALQNNLTELWSIIDWARPGFLGHLKAFEEEFVKKIERGQKHDATKRELAEARKSKEKFAAIRNKMMIRRTKKLIADQLPGKDDNIVFSKLTDLQVDVYRAILNHPDMKLILSMDDPCQCGSRLSRVKCCHPTTPDGTPVRHLMFTYMSLLMKTANHVALLIPDRSTSEKQRKHAKEICEIAFQKHPQFVSQASEASFRTLSDPKYCGKMKIMKGLLSVFQKKHSKILLFSYSTKLLSIVEQYVISVGYEYRRIDGSVSSKKRMDIVREFNNDPNIFICLISTKAGGLGLNLTGANVVIVFDPNWNPSYDLQAQDRAYRIGQRRNVQVYRLVSAGTIEENIYLRQVYKQQLDNVAVEMGNAKRYFHGIQGDKHNKGELFGLKNMFKLQTGDHCLTMDILKRNEKLESGLKNFDIVEYLPCSADSQESEPGEATPGDVSSAESAEEYDELMDMFLRDNFKDQNNASTSEAEASSKTKTSRDTLISPVLYSSDSENLSEVESKGDNFVTQKHTKSKGKSPVKRSGVKGKGPGKSKTVKFAESEVPSTETMASVSDVFEKCGVLHTHKNPKVIGSSRAEDHMSHCAMKDVFHFQQNSQIPAVQCPPLLQSSDDEQPDTSINHREKKKRGPKQPTYNNPCVRNVINTKVLIGQTPKSIKREHFQHLAASLNCDSETAFAERVLKLSIKERIELLNSFYESQNPELSPLFNVDEIDATTKTPSMVKNKDDKSTCSRRVKQRFLRKQTPKRTTQNTGRKVTRNRIKLGFHFDSSEESYETPANVINQSEDPIPSTSRETDDHHEVDNMIVGAKRLPRKSPTVRKCVKTRSRKLKERTAYASVDVQNIEAFPETSILESWMENVDRTNVSNALSQSYDNNSIPVDNLLDEMICAKNTEIVESEVQETPDIVNSVRNTPEPSTSKFSLLDDLFLPEEKGSPSKRKPPPSASKKRKIVLTVEQEEEFSETVIDPTPNDQPDSSKDLFDSIHVDIIDGNTMKTKPSLDIFTDGSKWKRRERKRLREKKVETLSQRVDNLISKGKAEYETMFTSGKMRKVSRDKPVIEKSSRITRVSACKSPDILQSPSLFS